MWRNLVDQKDKWIGGKLIDHGDKMDRAMLKPEALDAETVIVDFKLTNDWFGVVGVDFECGGSRECVGIVSEKVENGLALCGYGGHRFDIVKPGYICILCETNVSGDLNDGDGNPICSDCYAAVDAILDERSEWTKLYPGRHIER